MSQYARRTWIVLWKDLLIMARDGSGRPPETGAGWHTPWQEARLLALDIRSGKVRWQAGWAGRGGLSGRCRTLIRFGTAPISRP